MKLPESKPKKRHPLSPKQQIPLALPTQTHHHFDHYIEESNHSPCTLIINALHQHPAEHAIYLWGENGCGRSHLLYAACNQFHALGKACLFIPLTQADALSPEVLHHLEAYDLVCLDDLHSVIGNEEWELNLFNLYNRIMDTQTTLLCSATAPPNSLPFHLPDLQSRLNAGLRVKLNALSDDAKKTLLISQAHQRGFTLSEPVAHYILTHYSRQPHDLIELLDKIDQASLIEHKRISIAFIKSILTCQAPL